MDWLDLLAVQGTLKSLLQHHSSKASIFWRSAFSIVQLSHPYMTTGKTIALTRWTFVDKVISLLFNMQSRLVITFLPRCKPLLISWLQSPSAVILEPPKIKSATVSIVSPSICHHRLLQILNIVQLKYLNILNILSMFRPPGHFAPFLIILAPRLMPLQRLKSYLESESVSRSVIWLFATFVTPWIIAHKASLSMEFSRQEYWSG